MEKIYSPHDRFFRAAMSEPRVAKAFFEHHLPEEILKTIDLDTLRVDKEIFVDSRLKLAITDIVFSVNYANKPGSLYLLLEHRSSFTRWQAFILLVYMVEIMKLHHKKFKDQQHLPLIYPIVFYHGGVVYPGSTDLSDLFQDSQELMPPISCQPFQLIDLNTIPDQALKKDDWLSIMHITMKYIRAPDILPHLAGLANAWKEVDRAGGHDYLEAVFTYIFAAAEISDLNKLIELIQESLSDNSQENVMTIAQQLIERGRQEARTEVMTIAEQFVERGRQEARTEVMTIAEQFVERGRQEARTEVMTIAEQFVERGRQEARAEVMTIAEQFVERGRQQGQSETAEAIAMKLLQTDFSVEQVAQLTMLPVKIVARLEQGESVT